MKDATATGFAFLTAVAFVAFKLLRARQLSSPDPYNNPFTQASTGCLLAFFVLWLDRGHHTRIQPWLNTRCNLCVMGGDCTWRHVGNLFLDRHV
jgi:hypothetical protein